MTLELFARDPYISDFSARVVRNSGREIVLDRTAFYPGGHGQPPDKGELNVGPVSAKVIEVRRSEPEDGLDDFDDTDETDEEDVAPKVESDIIHVLDRVLPRTVREVGATLDWPRRHRNMRFNTALALMSGVVGSEFGASVAGGRIRSGHARLDVTGVSGTLDDEGVRNMETLVNREISSGGSREKDSEEVGGGLYVRDLTEVGGISVTRWFDRGSRGIRLEFTLVERDGTEVQR